MKRLIKKHLNPSSVVGDRYRSSFLLVMDEDRLNDLYNESLWDEAIENGVNVVPAIDADVYSDLLSADALHRHSKRFYDNPTTLSVLGVTPKGSFRDISQESMIPSGADMSESLRLQLRLREGQRGGLYYRRAANLAAKPFLTTAVGVTGLGFPSTITVPLKGLNTLFTPLSTGARVLSKVPRYGNVFARSIPFARSAEDLYFANEARKGLLNVSKLYRSGVMSAPEAAVHTSLNSLMLLPIASTLYKTGKVGKAMYDYKKYLNLAYPKPLWAKYEELPVLRRALPNNQ